MPIATHINMTVRYYRTTVFREVRKLLELRENDEIELVFKNGLVYIRKVLEVNKVVKCPFCGLEADANSFKPLRRPWGFKFYEVRILEYPGYKNVFNYYEGVSPKASSFTIKMDHGLEHE
ncbi:MAG: hypothetical protein QXX12_02995 [Nanopusillaceae archaeon]